MLKEYIKERVLYEWEFVKKPMVFGTILFAGFMQWFHNTMHNYVYYLAGQYKVYGGPANMLVDMGFIGLDWMPDLSNVSNILLYLIACISVTIVGSILVTNYLVDDKRIAIMQILVRACWVCCISVVLRIVSFLITILPAPAGHCSATTFSPPKTAKDILFHFDVGAGCSDLVFSSHQMYGMVAACVVHHVLVVGNKTRPSSELLRKYIQIALITIGWTIVFLEAIAIVRQRNHYSLDVWNACYAVPLVWMSVAYVFPKDVSVGTSVKESNLTTEVTRDV
jgi:hypothetical protein